MGLIGAPLILSATIGTVFGVDDDVSLWSVIALAPIFSWELSLGVRLVVKGFTPSSVIPVATSSGVRPGGLSRC